MKRMDGWTAAFVIAWATVAYVEHVQAAWNGLGVSGGSGGSDICNTANWAANTIDGDFTTINTAGSYTLTLSSDLNRATGTGAGTGEQFKFGCPIDGVQLTIASDVAGIPRMLTAGGVYRLGMQTTTSTNTVTFSADIQFNVVSELLIATGAQLGSGTLLSTATINGPMSLGARLKHTGGILTLNGLVSGTGSLTIGGNSGARAFTTLTCSSNTFSGGIFSDVTANSHLTATASTVLANHGQPSALGSGGAIWFPANASNNDFGITLSGFSTPQTTDRVLVLTSFIAFLFNNGTGPLRLTGTITNSASLAVANNLYLGGTYNSHTSPNIISGPIVQQSPSYPIKPQIIGNGIWRLTNPANNFTGPLTVGRYETANQGLQFTSAGTLGLNASFIFSLPVSPENNYLTFLGDADCTVSKDLDIDYFYSGAFNHFIANGDGKLTFTGKLFLTPAYNSGDNLRTLAFGGTGEGTFTGTSWLTNQFAIKTVLRTYSINLQKRGSGSWRFTGEHLNHEGSTRVDAGNLIFDYTTYNQMTAPTNKITLNEGKLTFCGAPSGTTEESLNTLSLSEKNNQFNTLALDANGGGGVHLILGTLAAADSGQTLLSHLFDLSSSSGNTLAATNLSNLSIVNGVLMRGSRADLLIKTADGVAFATRNGAQQIVPVTAYDPFPVQSEKGTGVENYLTTSNITRNLSLYFSTITADASANDVTIDNGGGRYYNPGNGHAILARGAHDVTIRNTNEEGAHIVWFHNYLTNNASLILALQFGTTNSYFPDGSGTLTFSGPGLTVVTKAGLGTQPTLAEGVLRMTQAQTLAPTAYLTLTAGGVLEIGADVNGAAAGDFSLTCGVASAGIFLRGGAGFSAYGADRTVNLGGAGTTLTWGSNGFLNNVSSEDHGFTFKLSSPYANAMVDFQNPIALAANNSPYGFRRTVDVADGAAAIDAVLSGAISGDSTLAKTGNGTLKVTAAQSYAALRVHAGTFLASDGCFAASNAVPVLLKAGATLAGVSGGSNTFGTLTLTGGHATLDVGDGSAAMTFADSSAIDWAGGTLTITGKLQNGKVRFGADAGGLSAVQLASIKMPGDASTRIDANGYLVRVPRGTLIRVQ